MADVTLTAAMRNNLAQLRTASMLMDATQNRIATGNKVNSALDDPTAFFKAKGLKDDASDLAVLKDDMGQTISAIQAADKAITSITSLVEQAKSLANSAKSESSATERASLAAQFDDIRSQIDTLAADASYGGQNLVTGRGTITGGTFLDTTSTTVAAINGASDISRTGTDTNVGDYTFATDQKLENLNTVITFSEDVDADGDITDSESLEFFINGVSVGTATSAAEAGSAFATKISNLSTDLTASITASNKLQLTVAEGKTLEIRSSDSNILGEIGITAGLQNETTGAQVVDLTSALGVHGAEIYAHVSGYTDNTSANVTFDVSGTTLTVTDGTGSSATFDTTNFSAAGTDTLSVGDMTVNFVTSTATEQANTAPVVTATQSARAQVSNVVFADGSYETGDEITVVVNGTSYAYALTAAATSATLAATAWETAMDASILSTEKITTSIADGAIVFTADTAGNDFTISATQTIGVTDTEGDPAVITPSSDLQTSRFEFHTISTTASTTMSGVFTGNGGTTTVTVAGATYTSVTAAATAWRGAVNTAAVTTTELAGGTLGAAGSNVITITDDDNTFTATLTLGGAGAGAATETITSSITNAVQTSTIAVQANVDDGDVYTVNINGQTITYTALAADTDETAIAAGLTTAINANTTLVDGSTSAIQTATVSGGTITVQENNQGATLTITASAADAAISLGNESSTSSTQSLKELSAKTATGDMRIKVTSGGVTETVDVNTDSATAVTISNSAWGSTFTFTADDSMMAAGDSSTVSVTNPTGTGENDAQVVFNTDGTSTINVEAVDTTSSGLSISASTGSWAANSDVDAAIAELDTAKTTLRSNSKTMATSLGVIQTRETFTENFIDNLRVGADKLTLADGSEEATNMLMLQTRQQLGIQALSMASQSSQSILSLFR